ncbi:PagC [Erwinia sp. OLTSP20]|uniref:Ail/Lom family outer membrane beta-barrel protein n=1 Tax=unclassified Erwinia TaxID=2622719 RepID=UPI000C18692B|nr:MULTISPECIES: Ail/Lom family outer membrane beta-barrel protein [unclassified Erwinia]PIJ52099.1 PagC [Erwinia sp. OAMSP11]PIJ75261.1 PagC [Erwinia sp. OLSSP12]PIJ84468.1 PagC [Erwinia sp. OLCASP19]PIJ87001.1 PagC [Erwinia sp. OLMTSP26]PIJ88565.1 PagC [Erwinia sp. OLMDSP33]
MKKLAISGLCVFMMAGACPVQASNTISIGYAQSKVENFKNMPGVNLQYRYEWDSPLSVVASFTTLENNNDSESQFLGLRTTDNVKAEYYSLLAGPAYRLNDYFSLYALAGMSHTKMSRHYNGYDGQGGSLQFNYSDNSNAFAYAAGIIINPLDYLSVTLGYEGSQTRVEGDKRAINGVNLGIGYRF